MFESVNKCIDFTGKIVIVTGGSRGIGEGCARVFLSAGATIVICSRDAETGMKTAERFCGEYGDNRCVFMPCDVASVADIQRVIDETIRLFGRLDGLINNAGYHPPYEKIDETSNEAFLELINTNLASMYNFCRLALPHLRKTKGTIVNMSSLVATIGQKLACRYVSTKGGILSLTKALAVDEAENGVRVNSISPGCIETPLGEEFRRLSSDPEREKELSNAFSPMKRVGNIYEVGTVCLFLASEMASFFTGADIFVSGGAELAYGI